MGQERREDMVKLSRDGSEASKKMERYGRRTGTERGETEMEVKEKESGRRKGQCERGVQGLHAE